jgi:hypothetical protein
MIIRDQIISAVARMTSNTSPVKKEQDSPNAVVVANNNNNNNQPVFPHNHPLRSSNGPNGLGNLEAEKKAASAFSQIIAPRAMHPFPRFSHPPSHFPSLPPGFPPNPFNPFFHNSLSPRNDLGNALAAQNPAAWQGKVGSRLVAINYSMVTMIDHVLYDFYLADTRANSVARCFHVQQI